MVAIMERTHSPCRKGGCDPKRYTREEKERRRRKKKKREKTKAVEGLLRMKK